MSDTQTTAVVHQKRKSLEVMGDRLNIEAAKVYSMLKSQVMDPNASDDDMLALVSIANTYNLNPFLKEIYCFKTKGGKYQPVVSIDGWVRLIQERRKEWDGLEFDYGDPIPNPGGQDRNGNALTGSDGPEWIECSMWLKGMDRPIKIREYFREIWRNTEQWRQMAYRMSRHKAFIQCGRIAFGFAGLLDEDDARTIDVPATTVTTSAPRTPRFLNETPAVDTEPKSTPRETYDAQPDPQTASRETPEDEEDTIPMEFKPAPRPATEPEPPAEEDDGIENTISQINEKMKSSGVKLSQVMAFVVHNKMASEDASTLMDIPHAKLLQLFMKWSKVVDKIKETPIEA